MWKDPPFLLRALRGAAGGRGRLSRSGSLRSRGPAPAPRTGHAEDALRASTVLYVAGARRRAVPVALCLRAVRRDRVRARRAPGRRAVASAQKPHAARGYSRRLAAPGPRVTVLTGFKVCLEPVLGW